MSLATIYDAVFPVIATGLSDVQIVWPNRPPKTIPSSTHVEINVMPSHSKTIGTVSVGFENGLIQFSVKVKKDTPPKTAALLADRIAALFPRNTQLTANGQTVRFDRLPDYAPPLVDEIWYNQPVTLRYNVTV